MIPTVIALSLVAIAMMLWERRTNPRAKHGPAAGNGPLASIDWIAPLDTDGEPIPDYARPPTAIWVEDDAGCASVSIRPHWPTMVYGVGYQVTIMGRTTIRTRRAENPTMVEPTDHFEMMVRLHMEDFQDTDKPLWIDVDEGL